MTAHTPARRFPHTTTVLLVIASLFGALWVGSHLGHGIGIFSLGSGTSLSFQLGGIEIRRIYAFNIAPPVPESDWYDTAVAAGWIYPQPGRGFPGYSFQSGMVTGIGSTFGGNISPANYWLLRLPLWPLILLPSLLGAWSFRRWYRQWRLAQRGFEVVGVS